MREYTINFPRAAIPAGRNNMSRAYLWKEVLKEAQRRQIWTPENRDCYLQRIGHEIEVFDRYGYIEYLLGIWQVVNRMKMLQIPFFADCRGYCASLVFYCLGITVIDPVKHDLMFARFMPADKPRFIEVELLISDTIEDICELREWVSEKRTSGHKLTLYPSNIMKLLAKTMAHLHRESRSAHFDLQNIPLDDAETYRSLLNGDLTGVYCLNYPGIADALVRLKPTTVEELIPICAMARPGTDAKLEHYLTPNGERLYIFHEEIVCEALACGLSESEADELRRAVVKRLGDKLEKYRPRWVARYGERSWEHLLEAGMYSLSKSCAAGVAWLAYATAYLKTHYPYEFTCAALCVAAEDI